MGKINEKICSQCGSHLVKKIDITENMIWWFKDVYRCSKCEVLINGKDLDPYSEWGWYHNGECPQEEKRKALENYQKGS